jgi:DNA-binding NarL/FixJ family response regulator
MRVLVVDDAAVSRAVFGRMAVAAGHLVVAEAEDAAAALTLAERHAPDAAVIDGRLPGDGTAVLIARLRERWPRMRIVILAALDETALVRQALQAGASSALLRPLVPSRVAQALADPA